MSGPRRSLKFSLPSLWLIGLCVFLPTVQGCHSLQSPAQLMWGAPLPLLALLSPFVVAQLLVIVAVVALGRGRVGPLHMRATVALAAVAASSAAMLAFIGFDGHDLTAHLWRLFAGACLVAGVAVLVRARRREPWTRLSRCHTAYALFTLPMAALLVRIVVEDGPHRVGVGAWAFLAAFVALAVVQVRSLVSSSTA